MKGCLTELRRLKKHYEDEVKQIWKESESYTDTAYSSGVVDGLDMAIDIIKNKKYYGSIK